MKKLILSCLLAAFACSVHSATITVDATKLGAKVDPGLYGLFFEEINHSGDGGIYAEMVRNRGFEDYRIPEGLTLQDDGTAVSPMGFKMKPNLDNLLPAWSLIQNEGSKGEISLDKSVGLNKNTSSSLKLVVSGVKGTGIANEGYWGMNIQAGASYNLSLYVRGDTEYNGKISAYIENRDGKLISNVFSINGVTKDWKQFKCTIKGTATDPKAKLVILASAPGTLWFDMVSMFPSKTFKNRPNGLRSDLVKMLQDLKPGFIRFPGGCIVEGVSIDDFYLWKPTIGPIENRPGKWNLWGYRRTDGLGFHEYLQMCEDLGCPGMYVFNAGMSCQWRSSMELPADKLQYLIDEALDAIEYANGPATSKWGAVRATNGHPKPFNIKYLEIGNENWGPVYEEHYKIFFDAIKKKYPKMETICCVRTNSAPVEMVDDHFYNNCEYFINAFNHYDSYDRKAPKVYIGEYCAQGESAKGNLYGGLSEACFLIGCERNADVVKMISYAPLLVNDNNRAFNPDAIVYDSSRVYGTASYQVLKMLGNNLPSQMISATMDVPARVLANAGRDDATGDIIIKVCNPNKDAYAVDMVVNGASKIASMGTETVLTSGNPKDENSLDNPNKIVPQTRKINGLGAKFTHTFPPYSFTVFRLKTK